MTLLHRTINVSYNLGWKRFVFGFLCLSSILLLSISAVLAQDQDNTSTHWSSKAYIKLGSFALNSSWGKNSVWARDLMVHVRNNLDPTVPLLVPEWKYSLRFVAYDCWKLPEKSQGIANYLRNYDRCYSDKNALFSENMFDILWVLIKHEWYDYRNSLTPRDRSLAAWSIVRAIDTYKNLAAGAESRSNEPFSQLQSRLRYATGYLTEISASGFVGPEDDEKLRQKIRESIDSLLAIDGTGSQAYDDIVVPIQNLTRGVINAYIGGIEAEETAKNLITLVYGGANGAVANAISLHESEKNAFDTTKIESDILRDFVRQVLLERSNAVGMVDLYSELKLSLWGGTASDVSYKKFTFKALGEKHSKSVLEVNLSSFGQIGKNQKIDGLCEYWRKESGDKLSKSVPCPIRQLSRNIVRKKFDGEVIKAFDREQKIQTLMSEIKQNVDEVISQDSELKKVVDVKTLHTYLNLNLLGPDEISSEIDSSKDNRSSQVILENLHWSDISKLARKKLSLLTLSEMIKFLQQKTIHKTAEGQEQILIHLPYLGERKIFSLDKLCQQQINQPSFPETDFFASAICAEKNQLLLKLLPENSAGNSENSMHGLLQNQLSTLVRQINIEHNFIETNIVKLVQGLKNLSGGKYLAGHNASQLISTSKVAHAVCQFIKNFEPHADRSGLITVTLAKTCRQRNENE